MTLLMEAVFLSKASFAVSPSLTTTDVAISLAAYVLVYLLVMSFGIHYIYRLLREGPVIDDGQATLTGDPPDKRLEG